MWKSALFHFDKADILQSHELNGDAPSLEDTNCANRALPLRREDLMSEI